ncbi:MAG: hypothetical protein ACLSAM_01070 [Alistipes onderdonkii]
MAENTTTRVVEVQVDNAEAIKLIADYNAKIEESTAKEKALREAIKKKGEATAADREELAKLRAEQTAYKRELREVEKEVQNNIKAAREEEGSNRKLRAELSNLTKQYDSMSAAMQKSAEGEALKKQINEITDALLESEEGTQRFYRNVGNYPDIKPLETQLGVIRQQLAQMKYEGKETTQEYQDLLGVAANMKDALADVEAGINAGASDTAQLDVLIKGTQNLLQLWAQWSILSKQLGVENKDLDKAIGIITQMLGALVAIQSVQNMLQKQSIVMQKAQAVATWAQTKAETARTSAMAAGTVATNAGTAAVWKFTAALFANPIGVIVAAIIAAIAAVYALVKAFSWFNSSTEKAKENLKKQGEELDKLNKKYDEHIEKMKALGKTDEEITLTRLALLKDLANKRAEHFKAAQRLYKKDSEEYKASQDAKKKADEDYRSALNDTANHLRSLASAYNDAALKKKLGTVKYATQQANEEFKNQRKLLVELVYAGKVASSEAKDILASLEAARDKTIKEAYKEAAEKQKQALATELAAVRAATDAKVALMKEGISKQLTQEEVAYRHRVADLKNASKPKGVDEKAKAAIQQQIELAEQQHVLNVEKINRAGLDKKIRQEQQNIALRLAAVKQGTDAEYTLKVEQLRKQQEAELANIELTEQQKVLIREKYNKQLDDLSNQWINANLQKQNDALRLEWENRINAAAVQGQNTLQLQLQMRQAELIALQQMEGESDAAFKARQLGAQQAYVDAKRAINDYEVQIEQAKLEALAAVTNGLSGLLEELGEDNKTFAVLSKTLALAEIAINTGKAIAAGTAQAQSVPFPGNLIAIATTVATIMANITSAIKTVKSAKFSTGGYVSGPGTSTSDSIPAMLSDGESVNAALPTSMFAPIYSALNQLGGGAPIVAAQSSNQIAGEDMLARAFAKGVSQLDMRVGVDEITRVSDRVKVVESLGDL